MLTEVVRHVKSLKCDKLTDTKIPLREVNLFTAWEDAIWHPGNLWQDCLGGCHMASIWHLNHAKRSVMCSYYSFAVKPGSEKVNVIRLSAVRGSITVVKWQSFAAVVTKRTFLGGKAEIGYSPRKPSPPRSLFGNGLLHKSLKMCCSFDCVV